MMQAAVTDVRSTELRDRMAEHWDDFGGTYRECPQCEIIHEDADTVVVDDHGGFQYRIFLESSAHTDRRFRELMYDLARERIAGPVHVDNPLVFDKS